MKKTVYISSAIVVLCLLSIPAGAQTVASGVQELHGVLENVYEQMIPLCSQLIGVARGVSGFAATFYIGFRVWRHIANAEPIDFFPLFRPFVMALCIGFYPTVVLPVLNWILRPTVTTTAAIVKDSNEAVWGLLAERENAIKQTTEWQVLVGPTGSGDREGWYKYTHPNSTGEGFLESIPNDIAFSISKLIYNIKYFIKYMIALILEVFYYAASLCIDTIRTFHLIVLAILGPLAFAMASFDGFQQSLTQWLARYINIFLWLPVANLFGAILAQIEKNMLQLDITQLQTTGTASFTSTDFAYLIFMIIGIIGYFTVPGVANYIVHAHTVNPILNTVNKMSMTAVRSVTGGIAGGAGQLGGSGSSGTFNNPRNTTDGSWSDKSGGGGYQHGKISGE